MRFRTDSTWRRAGEGRRVVIAGSPLRLFRVSEAGARVIDRVERGEPVDRSTLTDRLVEGGALHPMAPPESTVWTQADVTVVTPQLGGSAVPDGRVTVDDGSVPPIEGAATRLSINRGPAAARNAGRRLVDTGLVAFVDADVDVERFGGDGWSWLDALLPHFDDPNVGLVAPRVRGGSHTSLDLGDEPARIRSGTRVGYVPAAAIVVRSTAFDDVGGFDEALRFGEDVDFVWRLDAAGWSCRYEPSSSVWHEPRPTWTARLRQQMGYGSAAAALAMRHPRDLAPFRASTWNAAAWTLGVVAHPVVGVLCALGGASSAIRNLPGVAPRAAWRLAVDGQIASGRQLATAIRRVWWPIVAVLSIGSRRARRIALIAAVADLAAAPTDIAYGIGVWRGVIRKRAWSPLLPDLLGGVSGSGSPRPPAPRPGRNG